MGVVFEAVDTHLQRIVALKVMNPEIAKDELARKRFVREAQATASMSSDHIVTIHAVAQHLDVPYLAMEYLVGEPLDRWLRRRGRPSLEEALNIGIDIARGLAAAHAHELIHRDIKPGNIWLDTVSGRAKILDFGLARDQKTSSNLTNSGVILGTPRTWRRSKQNTGRSRRMPTSSASAASFMNWRPASRHSPARRRWRC